MLCTDGCIPLADLVQGQRWEIMLRMCPALPSCPATCSSCKSHTVGIFCSEVFPAETAVPCLVTRQCGAPPLLIRIFQLSKPHTRQLCSSWELPSVQQWLGSSKQAESSWRHLPMPEQKDQPGSRVFSLPLPYRMLLRILTRRLGVVWLPSKAGASSNAARSSAPLPQDGYVVPEISFWSTGICCLPVKGQTFGAGNRVLLNAEVALAFGSVAGERLDLSSILKHLLSRGTGRPGAPLETKLLANHGNTTVKSRSHVKSICVFT